MPQQTLNQADELLDAWSRLSRPERVPRFRALPRELSDNFFLSLKARSQAELVLGLPEGERRLYIRLLAPDDAADLIQEARLSLREYLLGLLDDMTCQDTKALLAYRADAAGGLMNPRFARLRPDASIDEAITYLRQQVGQVETIYYAYVLDQEQRLLGVLSLKDLVVADPKSQVRDVMNTKVHKVTEEADQEAVAHLLSEHGIQSVPVIDKEGRMKGVITVDDLVDVVREEASEDMQKMGGMEALDGPYLQTGFFAMLKKRAGWLIILESRIFYNPKHALDSPARSGWASWLIGIRSNQRSPSYSGKGHRRRPGRCVLDRFNREGALFRHLGPSWPGAQLEPGEEPLHTRHPNDRHESQQSGSAERAHDQFPGIRGPRRHCRREAGVL